MGLVRARSVVTPFRRRGGLPAPRRTSVIQAVLEHRPEEPMTCIRPATLSETARVFVAAFPGDVLYAVKCNPEPAVLRALWKGGVRHFDVASAGEVRLVRNLFPEAVLHFMHPIKTRAAIREAYSRHRVRDFVLDGHEELTKIVEETDGADDLALVVRIALPKGNAQYDLSGKFGAGFAEVVSLLRAARPAARRLGVSFHVGSQMLDPGAYERALDLAGRIIAEAGVAIDIVDVGGGFPVSYPGVTPPPLRDFFTAIYDGFARLGLPETTRLWCEPGRALVAAGASLVVQVQKRRDDVLYINDGIYGSLSDAGVPGWIFPARLIRPFDGSPAAELAPFSFYGPTCDSADRMNGPFLLPADVAAGDWIELGQLGAYGSCLKTAFNGFDGVTVVEVSDQPLLETPGHLLATYAVA